MFASISLILSYSEEIYMKFRAVRLDRLMT
jgi:hypothetical protein